MKSIFLELESKLQKLVLTNNLIAIKAEFEAEGTRIDELAVLSDLCCKNNVPLTLKIGGPSAQRDIYEAFQLGATNIMAPMIESGFAVLTFTEILDKYLKSFKGLKTSTNFFINIESLLAIQNFESILDTIINNKLSIKCLVIGRSDLSSSLGINNVDSEKILDISKEIVQIAGKHSIPVAIGGNLTKNSYEFIRVLSDLGLYAFESRKCTYKVENEMSESYFRDLIKFGLEFELSWLKCKKAIYLNRSEEENSRIESIKYRIRL